jgi:cell division septum initiation protein DivIVA
MFILYLYNLFRFIKKNLSAPEELDQENLKNEYLKLKEENEKLRQRVTELQKQLESMKGDEDGN